MHCPKPKNNGEKEEEKFLKETSEGLQHHTALDNRKKSVLATPLEAKHKFKVS